MRACLGTSVTDAPCVCVVLTSMGDRLTEAEFEQLRVFMDVTAGGQVAYEGRACTGSAGAHRCGAVGFIGRVLAG